MIQGVQSLQVQDQENSVWEPMTVHLEKLINFMLEMWLVKSLAPSELQKWLVNGNFTGFDPSPYVGICFKLCFRLVRVRPIQNPRARILASG